MMAEHGFPVHRRSGVFLNHFHTPVVIDVARSYMLSNGELRWVIRHPIQSYSELRCITLRLQSDNTNPFDYVYFESLPDSVQRRRLSDQSIREIGVSTLDLDGALELLLHGAV
jgi:hypothetical protein